MSSTPNNRSAFILPKLRDPLSPKFSDQNESIYWRHYCNGANDLIQSWCRPIFASYQDLLKDLSNAEKELGKIQLNGEFLYVVEYRDGDDDAFEVFHTLSAAKHFSKNHAGSISKFLKVGH